MPAGTTAQTSAWVRRFHPSPDAGTRLVCFPYAGGSAPYYLSVSKSLFPEVEVLAIQYPGRQDRRSEPCVSDLSTLADSVAEQLGQWLDRPLALFGHSMGATLAFEVAVRLQRSGTVPLCLFPSGRRAPSRTRTELVHLLDDKALIAEVKRLSGTDVRLLDDEEVWSMALPAIRSDYTAVETYRYQPVPRLSCPVVALTGDRDPQVTHDEAEAWAGHTSSSFELKVFAGGHFFLNDHAYRVTELIRDRLTALRLS